MLDVAGVLLRCCLVAVGLGVVNRDGIQRRYSGAQAAVGRGGDMMRFGPLLITTGFHKVRVSCVGGVRWGEVEEMRDIFGMGEWMIILRVEEEDLRGSGVVGIGTGEGWRGRVEQKWFEAVFGEVSLGKGECRRGIVVDGLEEVVGVFVWQGTIGLYLSYADTCYGETDRQFVQTKGNSKVYLLSVYHIDVGKELSVFATTQRPAASVFRAKEMLHNQLPDEHPNLFDEEYGEWICFLGSNSSSGIKKYRGLNSSDGGNIRDRVKIAGGVIGSGDEIGNSLA
ncbi:hypothetical protein Tco_1503414 [Tanacetum coccineum]